MADIFNEVDEDVRKDKSLALWKAYGKYVIGAAVLIVVMMLKSLYFLRLIGEIAPLIDIIFSIINSSIISIINSVSVTITFINY